MNDDTTTSNDYSQAREDWLRAKAERLGLQLTIHGDEGLYTLTCPLDGRRATYFVGLKGPDGIVEPITTLIDMDELEEALALFETAWGLPS
jgi:hypothetical protein